MFGRGDSMQAAPGAFDYLQAIGDLDPETAYFAVDGSQQITFWSKGAEQLLGYPAAEAMGQHCSMAISCVRCSKGCGIMEHGQISDFRLLHFHKDGRQVPTRKWARAFRDADGRFLGGVEILRPLPELPRVESELTLVDFHGILTADPDFLAQLTMLRRVAHSEASVLIRGETGTGKELVARALHAMSPRSQRPFVAVNCGTLSRDFLASEIFGHRRGAFTGAVADKRGLLAEAEGGTLFLDEVAELPLDVQAMLLRVIQERRYTPLGDSRDRSADIRIVSATHRSLRDAVKLGQFREDLMFRLRVVPVFLPPLRERTSDVLLLWQHLLAEACRRYRLDPPRLTAESLALLKTYAWPGNIREMINLAEYLAVTRSGQDVGAEHLLPEIRERRQPSVSEASANVQAEPEPPKPLARVGHSLNAAVIEEALRREGGNLEQAAAALGVSRITLWRWRKKLGLFDGSGVS